jgi:polyisoprenoid-binding protein YceI
MNMERTLQPTLQPQHNNNTPTSNQWVKVAQIAIVTALIVGALVSAYLWFSGGNGQASAPITAPVLERGENDTRALLHITSEDSEVRFIIDEILLGEPTTVVGATNEVAGDMLIDFETPANSQLGAIRINARMLRTDNEIRNRVLRGQILQSERDEYEFVEFIPTALVGMPDTVTIGEQFSFQIQGYLTVRGVSREVTFEATILPVSETRLQGAASTIIRYADFGIVIPSAAGVAGVSEEVRLQIDFVATTAEDTQ